MFIEKSNCDVFKVRYWNNLKKLQQKRYRSKIFQANDTGISIYFGK